MDYLTVPGDLVDPAGLTGKMSKELWEFLSRALNPYARAVEARRTSFGGETIVFDLDVEVSQVRVHDILPVERISATFFGQNLPEVLALRPDFPYVPHINPRPDEFPRSLCLYDESFDELSLRGIAAAFVERLRWWLSEISKGTLHREDQPLEGIFLDRFATIVLPADLLEKLQDVSAQRLFIAETTKNAIYRASWHPKFSVVDFAATAFAFPPHVHGVIRWRPGSMRELADQLHELAIDFIAALRARVKGNKATYLFPLI